MVQRRPPLERFRPMLCGRCLSCEPLADVLAAPGAGDSKRFETWKKVLNFRFFFSCLFVCLVGCLVGWLVGWLARPSAATSRPLPAAPTPCASVAPWRRRRVPRSGGKQRCRDLLDDKQVVFGVYLTTPKSYLISTYSICGCFPCIDFVYMCWGSLLVLFRLLYVQDIPSFIMFYVNIVHLILLFESIPHLCSLQHWGPPNGLWSCHGTLGRAKSWNSSSEHVEVRLLCGSHCAQQTPAKELFQSFGHPQSPVKVLAFFMLHSTPNLYRTSKHIKTPGFVHQSWNGFKTREEKCLQMSRWTAFEQKISSLASEKSMAPHSSRVFGVPKHVSQSPQNATLCGQNGRGMVARGQASSHGWDSRPVEDACRGRWPPSKTWRFT